MPAKKGAIHAYITPEAMEAWQGFAAANGVSVTALLQALGDELMQEKEEAEEHREAWVKAGRQVDARNRMRGRKS